jgi:hypothetical protein
MKRRAMLAAVALLATPALAQQNEPWELKQTPFGRTAVGLTRVAANGTANVLAVGLYCGRTQPRMYLYGLSDDRMANGKPVAATVTVDGEANDFSLQLQHDAVVVPVRADFVRTLTRAKVVTVAVKDYDPPLTDTLNMDKAATVIPAALRLCLKP